MAGGWRAYFSWVTAGGLAVLDWVLPPRCAGCGIITGRSAGFCPTCFAELNFLGEPACARCDRPFAMAQGDGALCGACIADPPPWDRARATLAYGRLPRTLVLRLKYGRRVALAGLAARLMARKLPDEGERTGGTPWYLVPVPLHRWRLWHRGFNQSAEIARELAKLSGFPLLPDALLRTRATPSLRGLGRRDRARAVRGAFGINPRFADQLRGASIVLIDDVLTSGATADACARTLRRAGVAQVQLLVFARVIEDSDQAMIDTLDGDSDIISGRALYLAGKGQF
jgi:ComF family protein